METLPERNFAHWRGRLWSIVKGTKVLEVGVGTGKNMLFYPHDMDIIAIDLTQGFGIMLCEHINQEKNK
ncbi:MAG: hypothetical protein IBX69_10155 [Anaerolineales bacterium]|nr:hypothetical protein [Anaerolineales bacterium]